MPGAPTAVTATMTENRATVGFTAPPGNGGAMVTGYTVTASPGGRTGTCTASPCTVNGLTYGTAYTFTVRAANRVADSPESAPSAPVTPYAVPAVPTAVTATAGARWAELSFACDATSYTVSASPGGRKATCPGSPCRVTALTNGVTYTLTVHATANGLSSAESAPVTATPRGVPAAPASVTAVAGDKQASVRFDASTTDGGSPITGFTVTASPGGRTGTCAASPCTVTGLTNGTAYAFTAHAINALGNSPESAASSPVTPLSPLGRPTATAGTSSVTVSWTAADPAPVKGYTVTADPGPASCTTTATSCTVGAEVGVTYTYTVVANATGGSSAPSPASKPVTPLRPVAPPAVPTTPLSLTTDRGAIDSVGAGATVVVMGSGYAPYSTVTLTAYSAPVPLGTVVTGADCKFRLEVRVPAALAGETHHIVSLGVSPDGRVRAMKLTLAVREAADLPVTGPGTAWPALLGLLAVAAGLLLRRAARPQRARAQKAGA